MIPPYGWARSKKALVARNVATATDYYKEAYDMKITLAIAKEKLNSAISAISDISWMYHILNNGASLRRRFFSCSHHRFDLHQGRIQ